MESACLSGSSNDPTNVTFQYDCHCEIFTGQVLFLLEVAVIKGDKEAKCPPAAIKLTDSRQKYCTKG